jgi:hypothetical protein
LDGTGNQDYHVDLADALQQCQSLVRFVVEPLEQHWKKPSEEPAKELPEAAQISFVKMIQSNYGLEDFRMVKMFSPERQALMEFYLRLNRAGRRTVCFPQQDHLVGRDNQQDDKNNHTTTHSDNKQAWLMAIISVNDDVRCIFYFLSLNPSLCNSMSGPDWAKYAKFILLDDSHRNMNSGHEAGMAFTEDVDWFQFEEMQGHTFGTKLEVRYGTINGNHKAQEGDHHNCVQQHVG